MQSQQIDKLAKRALRNEVSGCVKQKAAPGKAWFILDQDCWHVPGAPDGQRRENIHGQELPQCLSRVKYPIGISATHHNTLWRDLKHIPLFSQMHEFGIDAQNNSWKIRGYVCL